MQMSLVIDGLEEQIKRVRMLPFGTITGPFGRMVRDLANISKKEVILEISGGDVELDKRVLEQIKDPIIHLLRNAIDHGIELPEERHSAGKPTLGTIRLAAEQQGKDIAISVSDDGAGLDLEAIRQAANRRGVVNANAMTDAELVELIYTPGFSTSPIITDISGRGVGLDVVRRNVENLRGRISVDWTLGIGSRFTLILPLTLTSSRGLLVRVSNQIFAIPLNAIERIEHVKREDVVPMGGHDTLQFSGRPLMLVHLGDVLGLSRVKEQTDNYRIPVVILSAAERYMAFAVDELADEQEVVIKGLGKQLSRVGGIAGASVMGNGEVILILNVADLIKLAHRGEQRSVLSPSMDETSTTSVDHPRRRILIVDDSITTRTLEKSILEAAGYTVQLAMDGLEALSAIAGGDIPDLIISDIAMPRLDGFGLTERLKNDARTAHLPLILVTSFDSPEDKTHGIEVGADAYIVKSAFDQNNLLETIEQLL
jgi:two-component system chemotaxis sensor kinase CheA